MDNDQRLVKEPWLAVNLSLLWPGIGQFYAGAPKAGLLFVVASLGLTAGLLWAVLGPGLDGAPGVGLAAALFGADAVLVIASLVHAHRRSRRANSPAAEATRKLHKDRYLAIFLSRILPGVGHVYLGWALSGGVIILLTLVLWLAPLPMWLAVLNMGLVLPVYTGAVCLWAFLGGRFARPHRKAAGVCLSVLVAVAGAAGVGLALAMRATALEAFHVPTGAMAPTIRGAHVERRCSACGLRYAVGVRWTGGAFAPPPRDVCPNCGLEVQPPTAGRPAAGRPGDRILVWKLPYRPRAWDVIVFKSPEGRRQTHVQRLVGLPGQMVEIIHGDVYVRDGQDLDGDGVIDAADFRQADTEGKFPWRVLRKPPPTQQAVWRLVFDSDHPPTTSPWQLAGAGRTMDLSPGSEEMALAPEPGRAMRLDYQPVRDRRWCRPGLSYNGPGPQRYDDEADVVYDLKLSLTFTPRAFSASAGMHLSCFDHHFRGWVGPDGVCVLEHRRGGDGAEWQQLGRATVAAAKDGRRSASLSHVDGRVALWVGGRCVLAVTIEQYPFDRQKVLDEVRAMPYEGFPPPTVAILASGGALQLERVRLVRDVYYTHMQRWVEDIRTGEPGFGTTGNPAVCRKFLADPGRNELFVLGDNSTSSKDSRMYGLVPLADVIGRAYKRYWPLRRFGPLR